MYNDFGGEQGFTRIAVSAAQFFLLVASNTFLGVGTQGDMFTQIYLISHLLSCSCSHFFLCSGSAILSRRKMYLHTI